MFIFHVCLRVPHNVNDLFQSTTVFSDFALLQTMYCHAKPAVATGQRQAQEAL